MTSGNLAVSQSTVHILHEQVTHSDTRPSLHNVHNLFDAAGLVGEALREVHRRDAPALREHGLDFNAAFILGGQIGGEAPRLFHIYAAGNFIEATLDTPYFQIGESKYGKPILDRVITRSSSLAEAAKCALISMDSTIRSNLSVGPPLDLVCVKRDALRVLLHRNVTAEDAYYQMIRSGWSDSLRHAFHALPNPDLSP
jgi:putative proteasome-type protease